MRRYAERSRVVSLLLGAALLASVFGLPATAVATAPTGRPTLTSPASGATASANPAFAWSAVAGAAAYRIQISTSSVFGSTVYDITTYQLKATPTDELPLGTLYWRVAALDGGGAAGPWSTTSSFTRAWATSPTVTSPADNATLSFPADPSLFLWQVLPGASSYQFEIDDAIDFATPLLSTTTKLTSFTLTVPQAYGNSYYWHVRGVSTTGQYSPWSAYRKYTTAWPSVPVLTLPVNQVSPAISDIAFAWNPVPGARSYELQVSPNGDWQNNKSIDVEVVSTRYSPPTTLLNAAYFWRVRARDTSGNYGSWSAVWQFTRAWPGRPTLFGNVKGAGSLDVKSVEAPVFEWTPVQRASRYQLQVGTDPNFTPNTYRDCYTNHTSYTPYWAIIGQGCGLAGFVPGTVYYWHVRGVDDGSNAYGLWSNVSDMDLGAFNLIPALVAPTSPATGVSVATPVLVWSASEGAVKYRVTILDKDQKSLLSVDTYALSYTPTSVLDPLKGPFSWYVQWQDPHGYWSLIPDSSTWRTFSLVSSSVTPAATPDAVSPLTGTFTRMPSLTWKPVAGASTYRVSWIQAGVEHDFGVSVAYTAYTPSDQTFPVGSYSWRVRAYDSGSSLLGGGPGAAGAFTIAAPTGVLASGDYLGPTKCVLPGNCTPVRDTPTMTWNASPGMTYYKVYLALDASFTNIVREYDTEFTSLTPTESLLDNQAGQAYYWFVRGCQGLCSRFDSGVYGRASAFQKSSAAVALLSATGSGNVAFTWTPYLTTSGAQTPPVTQEAKAFHIQVALAADFNSIIDDATVDQPFYTPFDKTYPINTDLYWRVQAVDGSNNPLTMGTAVAPFKRTVSAPSLKTPANGTSGVSTPYLAWYPANFAATYEVEIARNGDLAFSLVNRVTSITTSMTAWASTDALPGGTYAWRVRTLDAQGRPSPWSGGRTFTLTGGTTLLGPASGTHRSASGLVFSWSSVVGAVRYRLQGSTTTDFAATPISVTTVMTQWAPATRPADGTWYWRVLVLDANGNVLTKLTPPPAYFTLTLDSTAPTVTITPVTAPSITGSFTATFSEPVTGISGSTFKMVVAGTTTAVGATVTPTATTSTTTAKLKPTAPLVPGRTYTLSVLGSIVDSSGNAVVPKSVDVRTALTVENGSPALRETWQSVKNASASAVYYAQSRQAGSSQTLAVVNPGTITIYGTKTSAGGNADVYLDGVKQTATPISFYSASTQYKVAVWTKASIPAGTHTVQLKVLGTKPAASSAAWVYLDSIVAGGVTYEENNTAFVGRFATASSASASGGTYDIASRSYGDPAKPSYTMTFFGTGVDVYATKTTTSGIANVFVDGVLMTAAPGINLYAAATTYKALVYSSPTLVSKTHVVQVVVTGATASGSTRANVAIDYLVVR